MAEPKEYVSKSSIQPLEQLLSERAQGWHGSDKPGYGYCNDMFRPKEDGKFSEGFVDLASLINDGCFGFRALKEIMSPRLPGFEVLSNITEQEDMPQSGHEYD